eukprot:761470-Rhodomonas_salina.1
MHNANHLLGAVASTATRKATFAPNAHIPSRTHYLHCPTGLPQGEGEPCGDWVEWWLPVGPVEEWGLPVGPVVEWWSPVGPVVEWWLQVGPVEEWGLLVGPVTHMPCPSDRQLVLLLLHSNKPMSNTTMTWSSM